MGDLASFVSDLVESCTLDLSAIYASYEEERGHRRYNPRLMVKLRFHGYANGADSSRNFERDFRRCGSEDALLGPASRPPLDRLPQGAPPQCPAAAP